MSWLTTAFRFGRLIFRPKIKISSHKLLKVWRGPARLIIAAAAGCLVGTTDHFLTGVTGQIHLIGTGWFGAGYPLYPAARTYMYTNAARGRYKEASLSALGVVSGVVAARTPLAWWNGGTRWFLHCKNTEHKATTRHASASASCLCAPQLSHAICHAGTP
jgi:hypothetical protein